MTVPATETPVSPPEIDGDASSAAPEVETPEGDSPKGNREARYRTERNDARTALEAANARIEALHRAEVERIASGQLAHPTDIFTLSGNAVSDYLNDDGDVDSEKVAADIATILAERPGLRPPSRATDPSQGLGGGMQTSLPTFQSLLQER